jgi:hypothetical protein
MTSFKLASSPLPGPARSGPIIHVAVVPKLYFYPSVDGVEYKNELEADGDSHPHTYGFGKLYVVRSNTIVAEYEARGGPKETFKGDDRHIHSPIPPGDYVLSATIRYTTPNWPDSCVPWGAQIREAPNGEVQYDSGAGWQYATGSPKAAMNVAFRSYWARMGNPPLSESELNEEAKRQFAVNPKRPREGLVTVWQRNDFGQWAFALLKDGKKTGFFIHTTPRDELTPKGTPIQLGSSHGCIHMRPVDRNEAKEKKYLDRGVILHVTDFDTKGRPA